MMCGDRKDDGDLYLAHLADLQADAWAEFVMTGRPSALADYLQAEGEVDANIRHVLIGILRKGPRLVNKGGRDSWRDYKTFVEVGFLTMDHISKTEACRRYASQTNQELRTVEMQYDRGSRIFGPSSDLFVKAEGDHET